MSKEDQNKYLASLKEYRKVLKRQKKRRLKKRRKKYLKETLGVSEDVIKDLKNET